MSSEIESEMSSASEELESDMLIKSNKSAYDGSFDVVSEGTLFQENDSGAKTITITDSTVIKIDDGSVWRCISQVEGPATVHHQLTCSQEEKAITAAFKIHDPKGRIDWNKLVSLTEKWPENTSEIERKVFGDKHGMSTPLMHHIKKRQAARKRRAESTPVQKKEDPPEDPPPKKKKEEPAPEKPSTPKRIKPEPVQVTSKRKEQTTSSDNDLKITMTISVPQGKAGSMIKQLLENI